MRGSKRRVFQDRGETLHQFTDQFLVHCPRCDQCAYVIVVHKAHARTPIYHKNGLPDAFAPRRLVCHQCGYTRDWEERHLRRAQFTDWYFHQPLWLQLPCCGQILWAYNQAHLAFLEAYVGASLRQTLPRGTLANKLPRWMMQANHRAELLACLAALREKLPG